MSMEITGTAGNETVPMQTLVDPVVAAARGDDETALQKALIGLADGIQQQVLQEAKTYAQNGDAQILAHRGMRVLTTVEEEYYQKLAEAWNSKNVKQALQDLDVVMPETIIDEVFTDLETDHPLLNAIRFIFGRGIRTFLFNSNPRQLATWSPLCAEIVKELTSGFRSMSIGQNKLSAFIPICKAMLDVGPVWIDRYVRIILREALALGLEDGILNGRGTVAASGENPGINEPVGMRKDLNGSVSPTEGYPDKAKIPFTSFNPTAYGQLLSLLSKSPNGHVRKVNRVVLVVNPTDYLTKIFPATTVRTTDGGYNTNVLPFPTTIIQSTCLAEGEAILGLPENYLMVTGSGQSGKLEHSDDYQFLEDNRVYLTKFYGNGQPMDNNSFLLLDISELVPEVLQVSVVSDLPIV